MGTAGFVFDPSPVIILVYPCARACPGGSEDNLMAYRDVEYVEPVDASYAPPAEVRRVSYRPSPAATIERWVAFIFGLIELLIVIRIVLLLIAARESNAIVSFIYSLSDIFVAPFRGILNVNEVQAGATALDVAAIVALIGWFVIELIVLALVRMFRPTTTA
jgi:uncharacterized protein YggT (Ycf19 family)